MTSEGLDSKTLAIWGEAISLALRPKNRDLSELVELLRAGNEVTQNVAEFLAWIIETKSAGRPKLPVKFQTLREIARNPRLFDAVMDFTITRANRLVGFRGVPLRGRRRTYSREELLNLVAARNDVNAQALDTALRRSSHSGRRFGTFPTGPAAAKKGGLKGRRR